VIANHHHHGGHPETPSSAPLTGLSRRACRSPRWPRADPLQHHFVYLRGASERVMFSVELRVVMLAGWPAHFQIVRSLLEGGHQTVGDLFFPTPTNQRGCKPGIGLPARFRITVQAKPGPMPVYSSVAVMPSGRDRSLLVEDYLPPSFSSTNSTVWSSLVRRRNLPRVGHALSIDSGADEQRPSRRQQYRTVSIESVADVYCDAVSAAKREAQLSAARPAYSSMELMLTSLNSASRRQWGYVRWACDRVRRGGHRTLRRRCYSCHLLWREKSENL